jgi:hypothetical protein
VVRQRPCLCNNISLPLSPSLYCLPLPFPTAAWWTVVISTVLAISCKHLYLKHRNVCLEPTGRRQIDINSRTMSMEWVSLIVIGLWTKCQSVQCIEQEQQQCDCTCDKSVVQRTAVWSSEIKGVQVVNMWYQPVHSE